MKKMSVCKITYHVKQNVQTMQFKLQFARTLYTVTVTALGCYLSTGGVRRTRRAKCAIPKLESPARQASLKQTHATRERTTSQNKAR